MGLVSELITQIMVRRKECGADFISNWASPVPMQECYRPGTTIRRQTVGQAGGIDLPHIPAGPNLPFCNGPFQNSEARRAVHTVNQRGWAHSDRSSVVQLPSAKVSWSVVVVLVCST